MNRYLWLTVVFVAATMVLIVATAEWWFTFGFIMGGTVATLLSIGLMQTQRDAEERERRQRQERMVADFEAERGEITQNEIEGMDNW